MKKKKIVVIGGGNGSAVVLNALKRYAERFEISAVISMSDSGGSSGALRKKLKILPPGDIMRAVIAMSKYDYKVLRQIFYKTRLNSTPKLNAQLKAERGLNLGNLLFALVNQAEGNFMAAVKTLEQAVESVGHAYPVTLKQSDLCVELSNGKIVRSEAKIDRPDYARNLKIKEAWLEPSVAANPEATKVIRSADYIILCPGSLYASVIATLLPNGIKAAIGHSKAKLIYVVGDAYEKIGETGPTSLSGFVNQLEEYLPWAIDVVVYNDARLKPSQKRAYKLKKWGVFKKDVENLRDQSIVAADFAKPVGGLSSDKLSKILLKLF